MSYRKRVFATYLPVTETVPYGIFFELRRLNETKITTTSKNQKLTTTSILSYILLKENEVQEMINLCINTSTKQLKKK